MPTRLECNRCGRYFMTEQAVTMLVALTGACACGGRFGVAGDRDEPGPGDARAAKA